MVCYLMCSLKLMFMMGCPRGFEGFCLRVCSLLEMCFCFCQYPSGVSDRRPLLCCSVSLLLPNGLCILNRKTKTMRISLSDKFSVSNFFLYLQHKPEQSNFLLSSICQWNFLFSSSHFTLKCIPLKVPVLLVVSVPVLHLCFSP